MLIYLLKLSKEYSEKLSKPYGRLVIGKESTALYLSPSDFFEEAVTTAFKACGVTTFPFAEKYIVNLLEHFILVQNLFEKDIETGELKSEMLAEMYLKAGSLESEQEKVEAYKKLGDSSLYISGFFGDSLNRKIIDIDYYIDMGGAAYGALTSFVKDDWYKKVFQELAQRFSEFVDVLAHVSTEASMGSSDDLLRLYERYARTGSDVAREELLEKGLIPASATDLKKIKQ